MSKAKRLMQREDWLLYPTLRYEAKGGRQSLATMNVRKNISLTTKDPSPPLQL